MTPAVQQLMKAKLPFQLLEYQSGTENYDFGRDSAEKLGLAEQTVFKTLVTCDANDHHKMVVAIIPVNKQLDLKALAKAAQIKKLRMADITMAERTTGYVKGGISPFGQKKTLVTYLDSSAAQLPTIVVSAGKRGLSLSLSATILQRVLNAQLNKIT